METEEFISGFCRTCNGSQTVCCEYEEKDGKRILTFMDCAYKRCVNRAPVKFIKKRTGWEARKSSRSLQAAD
ncbi:MAG: hypothetical protein ACLS61_10000 [Ruminococcus sp.]